MAAVTDGASRSLVALQRVTNEAKHKPRKSVSDGGGSRFSVKRRAEQQRAHLLYAQHGPETRSFAPTLTEYVF